MFGTNVPVNLLGMLSTKCTFPIVNCVLLFSYIHPWFIVLTFSGNDVLSFRHILSNLMSAWVSLIVQLDIYFLYCYCLAFEV